MLEGSSMRRSVNFSAGPAQLPESVLQLAAKAMIDVTEDGHCISIAELGHRGSAYDKIHSEVIESLKQLLRIPDTHSILLMSGGGSLQFSAVPLNLLPHQGAVADYMVTGSWSKKAAAEASKYAKVNIVFNGQPSGFKCIPQEKLEFSENAAYLYYCANETVDGNEFYSVPECPAKVPIVADYSSTFLSRPFPTKDFNRFGVIFAGAQKNLGPPGVCIVIVRNDLIGKALPITPLMCDYNTFRSTNSLYNTPPTISIYMAGLTLKWIKSIGGLEDMKAINDTKSNILYEAIDSSKIFICPVDKSCRSRVTVVFNMIESHQHLLKTFLSESEKAGFIGLAGHRSVGGLRAALFNAQSIANVQKLVDFMQEFEERHS